MIKKFVVYGIARVGSNYFINQLNNHPQILCHYEIFHPRGLYFGFADKGIAAGDFEKRWDIKRREREPLHFLTDLWQAHHGREAIGYKIFPGHSAPILKNSLRDTNQRKIILRRKDLIKSFVSGRVAAKKRNWTCSNEGVLNDAKAAKIYFLGDEFLAYLLRVFNFYNYVETILGITRQNYLTVYYEDIIRDRDATFNRIFGFLDVRPETLDRRSKFLKQNPEELEFLVENDLAMRRFLLRHDFFRFFNMSNKYLDYANTLKKKIIEFLLKR